MYKFIKLRSVFLYQKQRFCMYQLFLFWISNLTVSVNVRAFFQKFLDLIFFFSENVILPNFESTNSILVPLSVCYTPIIFLLLSVLVFRIFPVFVTFVIFSQFILLCSILVWLLSVCSFLFPQWGVSFTVFSSCGVNLHCKALSIIFGRLEQIT